MNVGRVANLRPIVNLSVNRPPEFVAAVASSEHG
jgi:hypothetical protein